LFFVAVSMLIPGMVLAQGFQTGTLSAVAKDQSGGALPGVTVTITSEERGIQRTGVTDNTGAAKFQVLPIGYYRVEGALAGFQTVTRKNNKVESDKTTEVPMTLSLAAAGETITVTGQQPVVDRTNVSANTQISTKEYEKAPVGRNYQNLLMFVPGVVVVPTANPNPQVHGAQNSGNVFLFDGADTTDTTTGTFGANLNFEAIQEVSVQTAGESAEYGRATGAVANIITKSGTNKFEGSFKSIQTNDKWNAQNTTKNQVTGASLARTRVNHNVNRYAGTLGGPAWKDHLWFFGAYEKVANAGASNKTPVSGEEYRQTTITKLDNYRVTAQITSTQSIWAKYATDPITGFIVDYWSPPASPELFSLTGQDQGGNHKTAQYSGIFGSNITAEGLYAQSQSKITVAPYKVSPLNNGAPHFNNADNLIYNGATFDGFVLRPRKQAVAAVSYFTTLGGGSHNFKAGIDYQDLKSSNFFRYPNSQLFIDNSFDYKTRAFEPSERLDFIDGPSVSKGKIEALYARDKFDVNRRLFLELGLRYEKETSKNDIGQKVLDTSAVAPRLAASFDLLGNGSTIIAGTAGQFYQSVVLGFADNFANIPQQANYDHFSWDPGTKTYVKDGAVRQGGTLNQPNLNLKATHIDELTLGAQQQLGPTVGVGVRGIYRKWHDLIEDVLTFDSNNNFLQTYINDSQARRSYKGVELTFEKRFSHNWNLLANYTYSQVRGNNFVGLGGQLNDYTNLTCVSSATDPSIGRIPCSSVNNPSRLSGHPTWDLPNYLNLLGAYAFNLGPVSLTAGGTGVYATGVSFSKQRSVNVLNQAGKNSGKTTTYFYNGVGTNRAPNWWQANTSLEATYRIFGVEIGAKGEVFNVFNKQTQVVINNTTWCGNTTNPSTACKTAVTNFGKSSARSAFLAPRNFRLTGLVRF